MNRMRTAAAAAEEIKKIDPTTPVRSHTIATWAKQGRIYSVKVGNRRLVSMDSLETFLSGSTIGNANFRVEEDQPQRGGIRRIDA